MINIIGISQKENEILLYYSYSKSGKTFCKVVSSSDGFKFDGTTKYVIATDDKHREEKTYDWNSARISKQKGTYYLSYKVNAKTIPNLHGATSPDMLRWNKQGKIETLKEVGAIVPEFKYKNRYVMYWGEKTISYAFSGDMKLWKPAEKLLEPRVDFFDEGADLEVGGVFPAFENILLIYYAKKSVQGKTIYEVGAALFDKKDPTKLLWQSEKSLWAEPAEFHKDKFTPLGVVTKGEQLILYWLVGDTTVFAVTAPLPGYELHDKSLSVILKRVSHNPILTPNPKNKWESRATFNSAAVYEDGKVHFLYRALGDTDLSVLGYATSSDGVHIDERSDVPAYIPREPFETPGGNVYKNFADHFASGGGYGGIEDPRITKIGDRMYLTYVAFDGANPPRAAMSSISVDDFTHQRWDKWSKAKLISAPGMVNKSAVFFPEKVNGKYVAFHRVYPNILIDYLDDLNFDTFLQGQYFIPPRKTHWDSNKLSAGAPPIKTKDGWLLIYHAVGHQDPSRYKIGAMLLDSNNPTKVLHRTNNPIIAPDAEYENAGFKAGVVYPCGAAVVGDNLHVYYGGADTVLCAASQNLDLFLDQLKYNQEPTMKKVQTPMMN